MFVHPIPPKGGILHVRGTSAQGQPHADLPDKIHMIFFVSRTPAERNACSLTCARYDGIRHADSLRVVHHACAPRVAQAPTGSSSGVSSIFQTSSSGPSPDLQVEDRLIRRGEMALRFIFLNQKVLIVKLNFTMPSDTFLGSDGVESLLC
jgi:hypothetical protein